VARRSHCGQIEEAQARKGSDRARSLNNARHGHPQLDEPRILDAKAAGRQKTDFQFPAPLNVHAAAANSDATGIKNR
jgi:hypothetical protein